MILGFVLAEETVRMQISANSVNVAFLNGVVFTLGFDMFLAGLIACFLPPWLECGVGEVEIINITINMSTTTKRAFAIGGASLVLLVLGYGVGTWRSGPSGGQAPLSSGQLAIVNGVGAQGVPQELNEGLQNLALQITQASSRPLQAVVMEFPDLQGFGNDFTRFTMDRLATLLAKTPSASIRTEEQISPVLETLHLGAGDLLDVEKSKDARAQLHVGQLLAGTVSDLGDHISIDARLVNGETGKIEASGAISLQKTDSLSAMLAKGKRVLRGESPPEHTLTETLTRKLEFRYPQTSRHDDLDFILDSCQLEEIFVNCRVRAFNNGNDFRNLYVILGNSYLVDTTGRHYALETVRALGDPSQDAGKFYQYSGWDLAPGVRRGLDLTFATKDLPQDVKIATIVVEFGSYPNGRGYPDTPIVIFTH